MTEVVAERPNLHTAMRSQQEDREHQYNWESGRIDYLGVDAFDNILRQLDNALLQPRSDVGVIVRKEKRLKQKKPSRKRSDSASPEDAAERVVAIDAIPGDRVERLWRLDGRPRAVITDEGPAFYEPGSTKPPPIAANDKQQDRIERDLKVYIQRQKVYIDALTGQPEDFVDAAEKRFGEKSGEDGPGSDVEAAKGEAILSGGGSPSGEAAAAAGDVAGRGAETGPKSEPSSGDAKAGVRGDNDAQDLIVGTQPTGQSSSTDGDVGKPKKDDGVVIKAGDVRQDSQLPSVKADVKTDSTSARAPAFASAAAADADDAEVAADKSGVEAKSSDGQSGSSNASKKKKKRK